MQRSSERLLTTHTGSLPRPTELITLLAAKEQGQSYDAATLAEQVRTATQDIVQQQVRCGVDIVNDGETGKVGYSTYVTERLTGFDGSASPLAPADLADFPAYAERLFHGTAIETMARPACTGPIQYKHLTAVETDIANLRTALSQTNVTEAFMSAASPGVISLFLKNDYYPSHEAYLAALADAMKQEYDAVHHAGLLLQVDCPDLAMGRHIQFAESSLAEFRANATLHVEALNHALRDIPPERVRMHLCWGNYEGPHHRDVPLAEIIDIIVKARPAGISLEAANPRHAHEWQVFRKCKLPDGKVLIPGVLDSTSNYIEHPELIAERLCRYAEVVGRENVIAGTDCGFATFAGFMPVEPLITWAKFQAMVEGARLASARLW